MLKRRAPSASSILIFIYWKAKMFNSNMYEQEEEMMKLAAEMSLRESESSDPLGMMNK